MPEWTSTDFWPGPEHQDTLEIVEQRQRNSPNIYWTDVPSGRGFFPVGAVVPDGDGNLFIVDARLVENGHDRIYLTYAGREHS